MLLVGDFITNFLDVFDSLVNLLPDSFLLGLLVAYEDELQPFYDIIGVVNWFIPFNYLVTIFTGWSAFMIASLVLHHFYTKL